MISSAFVITGFEPSTTPPEAVPTGVILYKYSGGRYGIAWSSGDPLAETQIGYRADPSATLEPTSVTATVSPGVTQYETGQKTQVCTWWARHKRGGAFGSWQAAAHSYTCPEEV